MTDWLGLRDRTALVAGAGGIGAAVALALARAGARVVTDVDEQRLGALVRDAGVELMTVAADLISAAAARRAVDDAAAMLGGLNVFVHAVGVNDRRPVLETSDASSAGLWPANGRRMASPSTRSRPAIPKPS
jgi:gluconate 5-dehydrogenase